MLRSCLFRTTWLALLIVSCSPKSPGISEEPPGIRITLQQVPDAKRIDVMADGSLFTSYRWPEGVYKPILYPIVSAGGQTITRGFPLEARAGERSDHRHQVGNWLNYGNVNGIDFWGNGHTGEKSPDGGEIRHESVEAKIEGTGEGVLAVTASWLDPQGNKLISELTEFHFIAEDSLRIIDRITRLTSAAGEVITFKDTKEGMFGLRVARALELPSDEDVILTDVGGRPSTEATANSHGVTGNYRSSEGLTGELVWGTRAKWMSLDGEIGGEKVSVAICDHPDNISYPTWWHARGYGLFSANPLGAKDFTKGEKELNFSLSPGNSITFRYRIIIFSGALPSDEMLDDLAESFANRY